MLGKGSDSAFHIAILTVAAQDRFLQKLEGIPDPEAKRKIIGNIFIDIFEEESLRLEDTK